MSLIHPCHIFSKKGFLHHERHRLCTSTQSSVLVGLRVSFNLMLHDAKVTFLVISICMCLGCRRLITVSSYLCLQGQSLLSSWSYNLPPPSKGPPRNPVTRQLPSSAFSYGSGCANIFISELLFAKQHSFKVCKRCSLGAFLLRAAWAAIIWSNAGY